MLRAGVLYLLIAVALVSPALLPGKGLSMADQLRLTEPWRSASPPDFERAALPNSENTDTILQLQPLLRKSVDRLPDPPLWNPHLMNGRPLLADAQANPYSLFAVPAYFLSDLDSLAWIAVLKWWFAALGAFALGRMLGMRFAGAFLAGLTYGFCFWMVAFAGFPHTAVFACLPWSLLAAEAVVRRPDLLSGAAMAAVTGIQLLAGQPEPSFQVLTVTVLFFAFRAYQRGRSGQSAGLGRRLATFGAGVAGGLLLAAVLLLPFAELLFNSADLADRRGTAVDAHLPTRFLLGVFLPDYWGRSTKTPVERFQLVRAYYAGAVPLMLAATALIVRPRAERVALACLGIVALGVVGGIPPFLQIVTRLPVFSGGHTRLIMVWVLAVALLAGWGLDELAASRRLRRGRAVVSAAVAIFALPLAWALARGLSLDVPGAAVRVALGVAEPAYPLSEFPEARHVIELASVAVWLAVAGTAVLLIALRVLRRLPVTAFVLLTVALLVLDLLKAGMGFNPAIDEADTRLPPSGAIDALRRHPEDRFVKQSQAVADNVIALRYGLSEADGYDLPIVERYDALWRSQVEPECPSQTEGALGPFCNRLTLNALSPGALRTLRLLGVRRLLQPPDAPRPDLPGLRPVYEGHDGRVYRIERARRTWVVGAQQPVVGGGEALTAVSSAAFDPARAAVTEARLPGLPVGGAAPPGTARVVRDEPERVTVEARLSSPGLVVLADTWFPGWKATVDGAEASVAQVDYVLRGVPVGTGAHTIDFRYEPWTWDVGRLVSLAALLAVSAAGLAGVRRRR